jgi:hypothetical protein
MRLPVWNEDEPVGQGQADTPSDLSLKYEVVRDTLRNFYLAELEHVAELKEIYHNVTTAMEALELKGQSCDLDSILAESNEESKFTVQQEGLPINSVECGEGDEAWVRKDEDSVVSHSVDAVEDIER